MGALNVQQSITAGGLTLTGRLSAVDNSTILVDVTAIAAQPGTVASGAGTDTGSLTMSNSGHGITTGSRIDVYWPAQGVIQAGHIAGMLVGTVSGTTVPVSGGIADTGSSEAVLPTNASKVTVGVCATTDFSCIGNNLQAIAVGVDTAAEAVWVFLNGSTVLWTRHLNAGQGASYWLLGDNPMDANPLAGVSPTIVRYSQADAAAAHDMQVIAVTH